VLVSSENVWWKTMGGGSLCRARNWVRTLWVNDLWFSRTISLCSRGFGLLECTPPLATWAAGVDLCSWAWARPSAGGLVRAPTVLRTARRRGACREFCASSVGGAPLHLSLWTNPRAYGPWQPPMVGCRSFVLGFCSQLAGREAYRRAAQNSRSLVSWLRPVFHSGYWIGAPNPYPMPSCTDWLCEDSQIKLTVNYPRATPERFRVYIMQAWNRMRCHQKEIRALI
jgi:hypothetical protein